MYFIFYSYINDKVTIYGLFPRLSWKHVQPMRAHNSRGPLTTQSLKVIYMTNSQKFIQTFSLIQLARVMDSYLYDTGLNPWKQNFLSLTPTKRGIWAIFFYCVSTKLFVCWKKHANYMYYLIQHINIMRDQVIYAFF